MARTQNVTLKLGGNNWYASPSGSATGAGSYNDPWDLQTAFDGGPSDEIEPGDTVWLRGGTYSRYVVMKTVTDAVMNAGSYTLTSAAGGFTTDMVGKVITVDDAGENGVPLVTTINARPNTTTLTLADANQNGDLTGKTAVIADANYLCALVGTAANPIVFRSYPREWAILEGQYRIGGDHQILYLSASGAYVTVRNLEVHAITACLIEPYRWMTVDHNTRIPYGLTNQMPHGRVFNVYVHDTYQNLSAWLPSKGAEMYGLLLAHHGAQTWEAEQDVGVAIDLHPAAGDAPAPIGTATTKSVAAAQSLTTDAHDFTGSTYTTVAVAIRFPGNMAIVTATVDGVGAMTLLNYKSSYDAGICGVALFGIRGATGSHTVTVQTNDGVNRNFAAIVRCFSNVHGTTGPDSEGYWQPQTRQLPPQYTKLQATSDTNHLVVDVAQFYGSYGTGYGVNSASDNTELTSFSGSNVNMRMSTAPGNASPATTEMGWTWTPSVAGSAHAVYTQEMSKTTHGVISAPSKTMTATSPYTPWTAEDEGKQIAIWGAGPAGAMLYTTIDLFNAPDSIELHDAPSTSVNPATAKWGTGKTYQDCIMYEGVGPNTAQFYGSDDVGFLNSLIEGNLFVNSRVEIGGSGQFLLLGTTARNNYLWNAAWDIGGTLDDMTGFVAEDNYAIAGLGMPDTDHGQWSQFTMTGHTFYGDIPAGTEAAFPDNTYLTSAPTVNVVVTRPNLYKDTHDPWWGRIYVYNWHDDDNVSVDLSSMVPNGTAIQIINAQDYPDGVVWTGTYNGGTVSLPMDGLDERAGAGYAESIAYDDTFDLEENGPAGPTGRAFNAFIVVQG